MPRLLVLLAACTLTMPVLAGDAKTNRDGGGMVILSDPAQGRTMGKVNGEAVVLQNTPTGTVGKIGKDKVLLHRDGNGNSLGKVGDRKLLCHTDAASGLTLCK